MTRVLWLLAAALVLAGWTAVPQITGTLALSADTASNPAVGIDVTITASGSCLDRGRPWSYRFCCDERCGGGPPDTCIYEATLPASQTTVTLTDACDYVGSGTYTAWVLLSCWISPEVSLTDTLEVTP